MKLAESIDKALLKNAEPPIEFMNQLSKNKGLANSIYFLEIALGQLLGVLLRAEKFL